MEVAQEFFKDKDEAKFLQRCAELGIEYSIIQDSETLRIYRIPFVADLYYFRKAKEVSVIYYQTPS